VEAFLPSNPPFQRLLFDRHVLFPLVCFVSAFMLHRKRLNMYYLALDFDGVLATEQSHFYWERKTNKKRRQPKLNRAYRCCPVAISNLDFVCDNVPDLDIVVSSTWRHLFDLAGLKAILTEDGFMHADRIVGVTPSCRQGFSDRTSRRGQEIKEWLQEQAKVTDWVAVDDHVHDIDEGHLVLTSQVTGFTLHDAYKVIERFSKDWTRPVFLM
jgi:hypothetical protein